MIMFADGWDGGDFRSIPDDLLADCQDSARMAERIVRDIEPGPGSAREPSDPGDALSWAIKAMAGDGASDRGSTEATSARDSDSASSMDSASSHDSTTEADSLRVTDSPLATGSTSPRRP
jgi:hypothetical protein